jgi:hypothetical protein
MLHMPKTYFLKLAAAAVVVLSAAAFVPAARDRAPTPDLCGLATRLGDTALTEICGGITYLGRGTFADAGLLPNGWTVLPAISNAAEGRAELADPRHFFEFDRFVVTVRTDSTQHLDMVLRTAAALNRIRLSRPDAYRLIRSTLEYPTGPVMADTLWKRRFERIIISFDKTPQDIAAGATVQGRDQQVGGTKLYNDYALISVDEVTIQGATPGKGSMPLYRLPSAVENYRAYMADGLIYTIVHESAHRYIDHLRGTNRLANAIYNARNTTGTNAEEIVVNETAMFLIGDMVSRPMHQHVMELNTGFARAAQTRQWLSGWNALAARSRSHLVIPDVTLVP